MKQITSILERDLPQLRQAADMFFALNPKLSSLFSSSFLSFIDVTMRNASNWSPDCIVNILSTVTAVVDHLDAFPVRVRLFLLELGLEDQLELLTGLSMTLAQECLQGCKTVPALRDLLTKAKFAHIAGQRFLEKLPELQEAVSKAVTKEMLVQILGDELSGFRWQGKGESWAEACDRHSNPIFKSRFAKLITLIKKLCFHVVGLSMEFRGTQLSLLEREDCPEPVPVIMHALGTMGKSVLGTFQRSEIGHMVGEGDDSEDMLNGQGGAQELVHRYKALINTNITVKDAKKEDSHIGLAHNVTKIRQLVNRREELFANLIDRRGMMPLLTLEISFCIIYSSSPPTDRLRCTLYIVNNLTFILTSYLDASVRAQEKKLRKPKKRAIHPQLYISHIPDFYCNHSVPLPVVSEEDGESAHQKVKADAKRSDNYLNVIDMTRTSELIHDIVLRDFINSSKQNLVGRRKFDSSFRPTVIPHLAIFGCVVGLTSLSCILFFRMLRIIHIKGLASKFVFVFESDEARKELDFPSLRRKSEGCSCRCFCTCRHCITKCDCKCSEKCSCRVPADVCRCFSEPIFFVLSRDGFPEDGNRNFHLSEAPSPADEIAPVSWCEQFADKRGACKNVAGDLTIHCSAVKVRGIDLQPCGDYLRRRSICIIKRYRLRYRLRQLLIDARMSRKALSKGDLL
jgi:hypothetical protein